MTKVLATSVGAGAIYADTCEVTLSGSTAFIGNVANGYGGERTSGHKLLRPGREIVGRLLKSVVSQIILTRDASYVRLIDALRVVFVNESGSMRTLAFLDLAGAIHVSNSEVTINGDATFSGNYGNMYGGTCSLRRKS